MLRLRLGLNLESLRQPLRPALEVAARLGVEGVELNARTGLAAGELSQTGIRQIRKWLADLNLRVCAVAYPTRRGYADADEIERRIEGTKLAMKLAYDLGAAWVTNRVGTVPAERDSAAYRLLLEALADLGEYGMRVGARFAIRTGPQGGEALRELLGDLPAAAVGIDFDPGSLLVHDLAPQDALQALAPWVGLMRASDAVRDLAQGRTLGVQLGRGTVDFPQLFSLLERQQYGGYIVVEGGGSEPWRLAADAIAYLKSLF